MFVQFSSEFAGHTIGSASVLRERGVCLPQQDCRCRHAPVNCSKAVRIKGSSVLILAKDEEPANEPAIAAGFNTWNAGQPDKSRCERTPSSQRRRASTSFAGSSPGVPHDLGGLFPPRNFETA